MADIQFITGDATAPSVEGNKIICHVCNDIGRWGKGFVLALSKRWSQPEAAYRGWYQDRKANDFALGAVQIVQVESEIWVANIIGQHGVSRKVASTPASQPPIRYEAVEAALSKVAVFARDKDASVHMPRIGCGLAGGTWERIEPIIQRTLCANDINVLVYDLASATTAEPPVCLLRRFANLEEYERDFVDQFSPEGQARMRQALAHGKWLVIHREIEAELELGGELWEWESRWFHEMAGTAGLSVIRHGELVKSWQLFRS